MRREHFFHGTSSEGLTSVDPPAVTGVARRNISAKGDFFTPHRETAAIDSRQYAFATGAEHHAWTFAHLTADRVSRGRNNLGESIPTGSGRPRVYRVSAPDAVPGPENRAHPDYSKKTVADHDEYVSKSFKVEDEIHIQPVGETHVRTDPLGKPTKRNPLVPISPQVGRQGTLPIDWTPHTEGPHGMPWTTRPMKMSVGSANHPSVSQMRAEDARIGQQEEARRAAAVPAHPYADYANGQLVPERAARPKQGTQRLLPGMPKRERKK